ncbi:MFS transporter [Paraburkholderia bannensis]|uniref:MFS transporter n=1 Tax=Paraburkholderia bannensis TaxID=765414 RepID=UPI002ABD9759|nr:MFS transporter [Paraburkholderia bannensis]
MKSRSTSKLAGFTLLSVACLTIMVGCVIVPGLPSIASALGLPTSASWLVTTPSLGVVLFGPMVGRLIERAGLRRSLCIGLFLYGLLGVIGVFLRGPYVVLGDRLLLGGATAIVMSAGTGMISALYEGSARLAMIARQGMSIELGGVIFLSIGGVLAAYGWQFPFLLYLVAWVMLAMVWVFVPDVHLQGDGEVQAQSAPVSAVLKLVFFSASASMILFFTGIIALPLMLGSLGLSEAQTGYFLSFISLVAVVAASQMPRVASSIGENQTLVFAFVCYVVAHAIFALSPSIPSAVCGGIAMGCGFGFSVPLVNHMTVEQSPVAQRGRHLAYLSMSIFLGQFLSSFMDIVASNTQHVFVTAFILGCFAVATVSITHHRLRARVGSR